MELFYLYINKNIKSSGTATLIGDPPNIIIGSAAHLSFMDFILNLAPFILVLLILLPFLVRLFYKKEIAQNIEEAWEKVEKFDEKKAIEDTLLLITFPIPSQWYR